MYFYFPVGRIVVRKHSPSGTFPATSFSDTAHTAKSAWRRSPIFPKALEPENHPRAGHTRFSGQRLHLMRRRVSHFPATRFLLQPRLTPTSHPSYLFLPSEPYTCLFWGSFASAGPSNSFSGVLRLFLLNPNPCTCLGKCSSTFPVVPRLFFFSIWYLTRAIFRFFPSSAASKAVLGLSSIQIYFILQISRYGY